MRAAQLLVMVVGGLGLAATIDACGSKAPPPPKRVTEAPEPPPLPKPPPPPPCISVPDEDASITHAAAVGSRVAYCIGQGATECFALDLTTSTLDHLKGPPAGADPVASIAHVETTNPEVKVCTPSACKTLTTKIMPGTAPLHAATNAAGTYAVVLLGDDEAGKGYAEVWDVQQAKRAATIKYARGNFKCGELAFLGDTILITARTCTAPAARGALYSLKGKKLANVGNADFGLFGGAYVHVAGTTWAFLEENGHRIALQDVAKGKVLKTIDTSALWQRDDTPGPDAMGSPGESALVELAEGKLAVVAGSPATGSVAVVDVATGAVAVTRAPLCVGSAPAP
jgi:hypothetical protein